MSETKRKNFTGEFKAKVDAALPLGGQPLDELPMPRDQRAGLRVAARLVQRRRVL